ncbi:MAG TPA: hypothetical protein VFP81_04340 [Propionibacteriaceae bacterium]|nr:hypothetical protein [Propionibacteriaceae bacterium]
MSIRDTASGLGAPVEDRPFNVVVRVLDTAGQPTTVNQATTIVLEEVSGPGDLEGTTTAVIPRNGSEATISGARYTQFANGVVLRVSATSGVNLAPDEVTVDVALTAVGANATRGEMLDLKDPNCGVPTSDKPNCGHLLTKGADGPVVMSVGSCEGLGSDPNDPPPCLTVGDTIGLVVTLSADIEHSQDDPHSTMILACDKALCGQSGVPMPDVFFTLDNTGPLNEVAAPACPAKGVFGGGGKACVDYVSSSRNQGDLYLHVLFNLDARFHG